MKYTKNWNVLARGVCCSFTKPTKEPSTYSLIDIKHKANIIYLAYVCRMLTRHESLEDSVFSWDVLPRLSIAVGNEVITIYLILYIKYLTNFREPLFINSIFNKDFDHNFLTLLMMAWICGPNWFKMLKAWNAYFLWEIF